jgi:predicted amidohydrolase
MPLPDSVGAESWALRRRNCWASKTLVIDTELGRSGILICYENYLARIANKVATANVDLWLSPFSVAEVRGGA